MMTFIIKSAFSPGPDHESKATSDTKTSREHKDVPSRNPSHYLEVMTQGSLVAYHKNDSPHQINALKYHNKNHSISVFATAVDLNASS